MSASIWSPIAASLPLAASDVLYNANTAYAAGTAGLALTGRGISVTDAPFGAVSGAADSTAAIQAALNSQYNTIIIPSGTWNIGELDIPGSKTVLAYGAYFNILSGAAYGFSLAGYAPKLHGAYFTSAFQASEAAVIIDDSRFAELNSLRIINGSNCIKLKSSSNGLGSVPGAARAQLSNIVCDTFTGIGLEIAPNSSDGMFVNLYMDAGSISGSGGLIPRTGATGFKFNATGSILAFGGHQLLNTVAINSQRGYHLIDTNYLRFANLIADSLSGEGIWLAGNTTNCDFASAFMGTAGVGIRSSGTSQVNQFGQLRTQHIGLIPGWGGTNFFSSGGYSSFQDILLEDSSKLTVSAPNWTAFGTVGYQITETGTAELIPLGSETQYLNSKGTVAAGSTVYIGVDGPSASENESEFYNSLPKKAFKIKCAVESVPGAGQTFTYTLRVNGVDTAMTGVISGAASFGVDIPIPASLISIDSKIVYSLKLVTSAGAAVTRHRCHMVFIQSAK
jgi:hypothetical protein